MADSPLIWLKGAEKAKINFPVQNYCDATGHLIIDPATQHKLQVGWPSPV